MSHPLAEDFSKVQQGNGASDDSDAAILFKLTSPPALKEVDVDLGWERFEANIKTVPFSPKPSNYMMKVAAILVVFAAIAITYYFTDSSSKADDLISLMASDKVELVELPDQSKIWLRPGSSITYDKSFTEREIILNGEGYFDVTKGKGSFEVKTNTFSVKVLGTEFLIDEGSSKSKVVVTEGLVSVRSKNRTEEVEIGKAAIMDHDKGSLDVIEQDDPNALSWKTGKFVFNNTQLEKVIGYLNGYYGNKVQIKGNLKSCKVSGSFNQLPLSEVVNEISLILSLDVKKNQETYILSGKGC